MSHAEQTMISELLTDEQMRLMILSAEQDLAETRGILVTPEPIVKDEVVARMMAGKGKDVAEIAAELNKPLPLVGKWLAEEYTT